MLDRVVVEIRYELGQLVELVDDEQRRDDDVVVGLEDFGDERQVVDEAVGVRHDELGPDLDLDAVLQMLLDHRLMALLLQRLLFHAGLEYAVLLFQMAQFFAVLVFIEAYNRTE